MKKNSIFLIFFGLFISLFISCIQPVLKPTPTPNDETGSLFISKNPDKLEYECNDPLDLTGIEVKRKLSDGSEKAVEDWTSYPEAGTRLTTTGTVTVYIYSGEESVSFTITVGDKPKVTANEYFWGTWVRMDNGKEYEILETNVLQGYNYYSITASDSNSLTVNNIGTFTKQSDSEIICNNIPYFRKGGSNLEYSLKLVGFTNSSLTGSSINSARAAGTAMSGIKGKGKSDKYKNFESNSESDGEGTIKFTAPTANDVQTVEITNGSEIVVIPGLKISNNGDYMGTVALVGENDYNLKITGKISDDQKDNGYLFGNNAKNYTMELTITNISDNECSSSICIIESLDSKLKVEAADGSDLSSFPISTLPGGATKTVSLSLCYGEFNKPYIDTGITVTIQNPFTKQEWKDYIPLRFFKGTIPITIAAKSHENNASAALNGFIIYPDGNNQFFAIKHNDCKAIFVPTFGSDKPYMLVFSGATVTSELSNSTEMFYTVEPASLRLRPIVTSGSELANYMLFGGENHSETTAFSVTEGFEAYLRKGEIDYYKISADSDTYYGPGGSSFYSVMYENEKGEAPDTFLTTNGAVLGSIQLPALKCDGYKFRGWSVNGSLVTNGYKVSDDIVLTAEWQLEGYDIEYNLNGGTNTAANPSYYTIETSPITLAKPVKTGYDFEGWFAFEDFSGSAVNSVGGGTTGAMKLYAKWSPAEYTITYNLDGGTNAEGNPSTYTIETDTITLAAPQKEGFAFSGWFTDSSFSGTKQTSIEKGSDGNKTYYAKWLKACTVTYETEYSTAPQAIIVGEGEALTAEQLPELIAEDLFFSGWYAGTVRVTIYNYIVNDDVTLTAHWSDKCTVSYVTAHGTVPEAFAVASGTILNSTNLPTLAENGWRFKGWYTNSSYSESARANSGVSITANLTLYAKWEEYTGPNDGFVFVEGGTFSMGSTSGNDNEKPVHNVTLSSFYISDHELTQEEYETYCCYTSYTPDSSRGVGADYPVHYVSWYDAIVYCNLKSMAEELTPCYSLSGETDPEKWAGIKTSSGKYSCSYTSSNTTWDSITCNMMADGYRLPTEAEWEYAAKGGNQSNGYTYSGSNNIDDVGWYTSNSNGKNHEVKQKAANELGLFDMCGNVLEWCWDWYGDYSSNSVTDPCGASSGSYRVLHGGSWYWESTACNNTYRKNNYPYERYSNYGFRLARTDTSTLNTISYVTEHGITPSETTVRNDITDSNLPVLNADGWIFEGWYSDSAFTQKVTAGSSIIGSTTLYAKWHEFFGWSVASNGTYKFEQNGMKWISNNINQDSTSAVTIWEVELTSPVRYPISYTVSSEQNYDKLTVELDGTVIINGVSGSASDSYSAFLGTGSHTLKATYSKDTSSYSGDDKAVITLTDINYETQGVYELKYSTSYGTAPSSKEIDSGYVLTSDDVPEMNVTGCIFNGWKAADEFVEEGYVVNETITLTADWQYESYSITYYANGGIKNRQNPTSYTINDEKELLPATYEGKSFGGWFLDSQFTQKITKIEQGTTGNLNLYARWGEPASVTVTLPEYNDIGTITYVQKGDYITFTGPENYYSYVWQVDGSKMQSSYNTLTIDVSDWRTGRHVINVLAKNSSSSVMRDATIYVVIE